MNLLLFLKEKWLTMPRNWQAYLDCIQNLGMSRIDEIEYEAPLADGSGKTAKVKIVPLQFLKTVLPHFTWLRQNKKSDALC